MVVISMIVMYEDDSVEVCYGDGSCLQLSPCGSEFFLEKTVSPSAHPVLPSEKVRQRTRFVTSAHKELIVQALEFRNRFAARPYIPKELIPSDCRMHYFTDISEIAWPPFSSCGLEFGSDGEVIVSSVDGNARLLLSSSKEEFLVEFLCRSSQTETTGGTLKRSEAEENGAESPRSQFIEENLYTRVVQHHSCTCPPPFWMYPLSLALGFWEHAGEGGTGAAEGAPGHLPMEILPREERHCLPEALPLTCPAPHQHRWIFKDSAQRSEQDLELDLQSSSKLIKVLWCQGIVYRIINGPIAIIEISPGDGSVIRSSGAVANYFTHYTARLELGQNEEKMYFVNSLPPDVPGQAYSVSSVVTRGNRILKCYNQARVSQKLPNSHCCWRQESSSMPESSVLIQEARVAASGHFMAFSDGKVHVIFQDGVTLQMSFNTSTSAQVADVMLQPPRGVWQPCGWSHLILPDGRRRLLQVQAPGPYSRYVTAAVHWVEETILNRAANHKIQSTDPGQNSSAVAELEKIKRFNFLLEHSGLLKAPGGSASTCELQVIASHSNSRTDSAVLNKDSITEALQKTSKAIQDIEKLLSVKDSTELQH